MFKYLSLGERTFFAWIYNLILAGVAIAIAIMGVSFISEMMFPVKTPPDYVIEQQKLCIDKKGNWDSRVNTCHFNCN